MEEQRETDFYHLPIMLEECLDALNLERSGIFVDGTTGGAGHSEGILKRLPPNSRLICIDRDEDALRASAKRLAPFEGKFTLFRGNFFDIKNILSELNISSIDGMLLDLGVSSFQLDNASRGFSYQHDAPLDMRMDNRSPVSAHSLVNDCSQDELTKIIRDYGEEKWASRIAAFIVKRRNEHEIESTGELVDIIKSAIPASARRTGPHPAKRTFQALRIMVNGELDGLRNALTDIVSSLNPGGRLAVITFHSLEDRIAKQTFHDLNNPCTCPPKSPICFCGKKPQITLVSRKPITPGEEELERNPRSRSAKLRIVEKI